MGDTFFTIQPDADGGEWIVPTDHARGPWDPDACHGGPPTGMLVRALERTAPHLRLARISVDLGRPAPMAGFRIVTEVVRAGRATANTRAALLDATGKECLLATGMHIAVSAEPVLEGPLDNSGESFPQSADAVAGEFPVASAAHGRPMFRGAVDVRYPPGEDEGVDATTFFMRTIDLLPDEDASPFQRICPLADCGNAFSRHVDGTVLQFMNTDLVIALHRDPVGAWLGSRATSQWQPTGVGLASATLFDDEGPVGRALQSMLLRRVG